MAELSQWLINHRAHISVKSNLGEAMAYLAKYWGGLQIFLIDGRVEIDNNPVARTIRPIATLVSLCTPYSSVCKHWKRVRVGDATRAMFSGRGNFDRLRRQVIGTDLIGRSGDNLLGGKGAGFDKATYHMVSDA